MTLKIPAPTPGKPWTESAVYRVQCVTAAIFDSQNNIKGDVSRGPDPRYFFRVVPAHRCAKSLELRRRLAAEVRRQRSTRQCYQCPAEAEYKIHGLYWCEACAIEVS